MIPAGSSLETIDISQCQEIEEVKEREDLSCHMRVAHMLSQGSEKRARTCQARRLNGCQGAAKHLALLPQHGTGSVLLDMASGKVGQPRRTI